MPTHKAKNMYSIPSAQVLPHARRTYICGRADNACTNLLGSFVRYVRTRGMVEIAESAKLSTYSINPVPHALATHGSRD